MQDNKLDEDNGTNTVEVESHDKNGKKPRKEPRSLTDEEYEELFAAVLAVTAHHPMESSKNPATDVKEDDFDAILHEEVASEEEHEEVDGKAEEEAEDEDDGQGGDELNIDDLPQDVRADVLQMTNELTPCTSDVEDGASQNKPVLPPKMLHKKHSSSSKKQSMKPKQLKFDKNRSYENTSKNSDTEGSQKKDGDNKHVKTIGDIPSKCKLSETVHKRKKQHNNSMTDTYSKKKGSDGTLTHNKTSDKIKKKTSDGVIRSKEASVVGDSKHRNKKTKKLSKRQNMQKRQLEETGTWVQCMSTFCMKWRYLPCVHDPSSLPDDWVCHMNTDKKYNNCDVPQQQFDQREHDENYVFTTYTEGSIVWARMDGYPWWPAMVEIDPDYEDFYECRGQCNKATHYHVVFFDDKVSRAWLPTDRLRPFSDLNEPETVLVHGLNHSKGVNAARSKALQALDLSLKDRLQHYSFSVRYSGKWGINIADNDSQNSQSSSSSSCPQAALVEKKHKPQKVDLETFELADDDVEDMLNDAVGIMKDAEEILEFFPGDNEDVMSDYEPEKPKKPKKTAKQEKALGEDNNSAKKKTKRKLNEDGSDKKYKKQKSITDKPITGSKEKKKVKVKSNSSADAPKVKPSFQPPKQEKTFKAKTVKPLVSKLELDSDVFTMELSCDAAESLPKKSSETVKKSSTKKDVSKNDKENIDPNGMTKPHVSDNNAPKLASHKKTLTKPKVVVKPKFVAPNAHKLTKGKSKDDTTDLANDKDQTSGVVKKSKKFSILKKPTNEKTDEKIKEETNEKTNKTNDKTNKTNDKTNKKSEKQEDSAKKYDKKKTKEGMKNKSLDIEKTTPEDPTKKTLSPRRPVDDVTDDLSVDIEDKLFPDLELTSVDRRQGFDGDEDSEPFDVEPGDGAVTDVAGADKLNNFNAGYDSDPMEFEE